MAAAGGIYAAPTNDCYVVANEKSRAVIFIYCDNRKFSPHQSPAVTASPKGEAIRVVYPQNHFVAEDLCKERSKYRLY